MRIMLRISYNGSAFFGFQRQKDKPTIQGELEAALKNLFGCDVTVVGSGRTDAKVNALGQVVHFDEPKQIPLDKIESALNFYLPPSIRVQSALYAPDNFDARKSAKKKTYTYSFYVSKVDNPLLLDRAARLDKAPDPDLLKKAASLFIGTHDFYAFYCLGSSAKTTVRTVFDCDITSAFECDEKLSVLNITADGFLYKMVRIITGASLDVAFGKISLDYLKQLLSKPNLTYTKNIMPPQGLCLKSVEY